MKQISIEFTEKGWKYTQIERRGDLAIYRKERIGGVAECFELIRIQSHNGFNLPGGQRTDPAEYYPSAATWGSQGWTLPTLEAARRKMEERTAQPIAA